MACRLRNWLSKRHQADEIPPPPVLTPKQPIALTATHASTVDATAQSSLYGRIPAEIRRRILFEAFGGQTVHFDLRFVHPVKRVHHKPHQPPPPAPRHADTHLRPDTSKPRRWIWWSCVCHRNPSNSYAQPSFESSLGGQSDDTCRTGRFTNCHLWPGQLPDKCFIGVMGWLLTCRQAYFEGAAVLYGTNWFHIQGIYLTRQLPQLLLSASLNIIPGVELVWNLHLWEMPNEIIATVDKGHPKDNSGLDGFRSLCQMLPATLPNLRYLHLSLQGRIVPPNMPLESKELFAFTETMLQCFDDTVARMPRLRECRISLPSTIYGTRKLRTKASNIVQSFKGSAHWKTEALWRELPLGSAGDTHEGQKAQEKGYWICHGLRDMLPSSTIPEAW
ncbi:hypothetical protein GQ53DRAFT_863826 [Thozetella sp. PMI_491]|nr:hypothetical protein GQ53DRAFT_863826 [Thozetella sp. PMI_491]